MSKGKVLVVGSNATRIEIQGGGTGPTGQYLNETVVPAMAVIDAGYEVVLATPNGKQPYIDPASDHAAHFGGDEKAYRRARLLRQGPGDDQRPYVARDRGRRTRSIRRRFRPRRAGPGRRPHAGCRTRQILRHFHERKKLTALLCHGPIATLATLPDAKGYRAALIAGDKAKVAELGKGWQYAGYKIDGVHRLGRNTDRSSSCGKIYFTMPDALGAAGAEVSRSAVDFEPYVVEDRELITGQNPRSDHPIAAKLVAALDRAPRWRRKH